MSIPDWNIDSSSNKFLNTYIKGYVDVSGGDVILRTGDLYLAPDSSIFTENNQIQFNEEFSFCDFINNVNVLGQLKNSYNSVEYDVGLQCEKVDEAIGDIATLSPIVSDTAFKLTGLYWDAGLSSTVFTNNVSFPNGSISSLAINNSSFVALSGAQTIDGVKSFNSAPVMSGASITNGSIPSAKITGTACNLSSVQSITATKTFTVAQTFQNNIRLDGSLLLSNGGLTLVNSTLQRVAYLSDVNSALGANLTSLQTQITNINGVSLSSNNNFIGTTNSFNSISFTGTLNSISSAVYSKVQYLSNITSDIKASLDVLTDKMSGFYRNSVGSYFFENNLIAVANFNGLTPFEVGCLDNIQDNIQDTFDALKTKTDTTNINLATTTTNANDALQRTQEISFSDDPTPQTNITAKCVLEEVVFTTDLNNITPLTFSYLQGVTSSIQTQLDSKTRIPTGTIIMSVGDSLQDSQPLIWLKCNGQAVSRTTYVDLYQYILSRYGGGDGSTTFNVPNFQACFMRGAMFFPDTERVVNGTTYMPNGPLTIQQDSLEAHVHSSNLSGNYLRSGSTSNTSDAYLLGTTRPNRSDFPAFGGGVSSSHRTSTETRPLNHSIFYYIKT